MIDEKWSSLVLEPKFENATISAWVTDLSPFMSASGDIVHVPEIYTNQFTVQTQSTQGNGVVDESVAQVDKTITVNTHKYVAFLIGNKDMAQLVKSYNLNERYLEEVRNLLARALEDALFALWSSITTNSVGDTGTVLTDLEIRQAIAKLDNTNLLEYGKVAFFFHPIVYWHQVAALQKFYDKSINGMESIIATGAFGSIRSMNRKGSLYDIPVFTSPRVVSGLQTYRNMLLHKEAMGFAVQTNGGGMIRTHVSYLHQNLATLATGEIIYGVGMLREPSAVLINANTTATAA